jgi:hypothetical protein
MSVETSSTNDSDDERTFGYRSADSAALDDDDLDDDEVMNSDDDTVVRGTVVDEDDDTDDEDAVVADPDAVTYSDTAADRDTGAYSDTAADRDAVGYPDTAADQYAVTDADDPQPTFTPVDDGPVSDVPDASAPTLSETDNVPVVPVSDTAVTEAPLSSVTDIDPNAPLLADSVSLRASWQQAQAGFVDDPRAAVADAAELVEHTAQTLIGSLQQRQRALRTQWDNNGSGAASPSAAGELSDTEQLRHLMQDYRNLFNQLCQP